MLSIYISYTPKRKIVRKWQQFDETFSTYSYKDSFLENLDWVFSGTLPKIHAFHDFFRDIYLFQICR